MILLTLALASTVLSQNSVMYAETSFKFSAAARFGTSFEGEIKHVKTHAEYKIRYVAPDRVRVKMTYYDKNFRLLAGIHNETETYLYGGHNYKKGFDNLRYHRLKMVDNKLVSREDLGPVCKSPHFPTQYDFESSFKAKDLIHLVVDFLIPSTTLNPRFSLAAIYYNENKTEKIDILAQQLVDLDTSVIKLGAPAKRDCPAE